MFSYRSDSTGTVVREGISFENGSLSFLPGEFFKMTIL